MNDLKREKGKGEEREKKGREILRFVPKVEEKEIFEQKYHHLLLHPHPHHHHPQSPPPPNSPHSLCTESPPPPPYLPPPSPPSPLFPPPEFLSDSFSFSLLPPSFPPSTHCLARCCERCLVVSFCHFWRQQRQPQYILIVR